MRLPPQFLAPLSSVSFLPRGDISCTGRGWGAARRGTLTPGHPFFWERRCTGTPRESNVEHGLCSLQRPGAIVCGRADQYGAPLGSNITSKVALATEAEAGARQRWHRAPPWHGGPCCGGQLGCPSGGNSPRLTLGLGSPETAAGGRGGRGGRLDLTAPLLLHPRSQEWEQTWGSWKIPETSVARRQGGVNVSKKVWAVLVWSPH